MSNRLHKICGLGDCEFYFYRFNLTTYSFFNDAGILMILPHQHFPKIASIYGEIDKTSLLPHRFNLFTLFFNINRVVYCLRYLRVIFLSCWYGV